MRILTVSAHYPPNFTSGGTLQPQRLARALAARGHQSSVYAGWLGDRQPLSAWDESDETGLAVHWITTTPWIGWDDQHNWHNPAVTDEFRGHLQALAPQLVHFHSLQSLGAGLVPAAKASGAAVVVTMHDFWWLCARQFLVDTEMRPCSLVVEAGACACQVDQAWRRHRGQALAAVLESADLVLAPSESARRVLAANGVAPGRLALDENGLPDEVLAALAVSSPGGSPARLRPDDAPVRFLYAGGPDPMKGADVLVEAAARLGRDDPTGWTLSAFGLAPGTAAADGLVGLPVEMAGPYDPADLGAILADHDVLVLASVIRETHSLLTREALAAGLAVLCTDTLGPEEVVVDGHNGIIVPAGDAGALAAALGRLARDQALVARLRAGAAAPLAVRSLDQQVDGLEARFEQLISPEIRVESHARGRTSPRISRAGDPSAGPAAGPGAVGRVVFATGIDGAPLRYRARLPAEALALVGVQAEVRHYRDPELLAAAIQADVVVCYRVPATVAILELIEACHGAGVAVAFDVDDLIFDPELRDQIPALRLLPPDEAELWMQGVTRYRTTLEACDAFIGSTDLLVERAAELTGLPAHRFDNGVGLELARASDAALARPRRPGPPRVGYLSGTITHDEDWRFVEPAVVEILDRHPDLELWLVGHLPEDPALTRFGPRVVRTGFRPWTQLPEVLRDLDVNLAPLEPGAAFNQAKSAIKWLEAALCATPTVASPTDPFRQAISDGVDGRLAGTVEEWVDALDAVLDDEASRLAMGARARRHALLDWSPALQGARYHRILTEIAAAGPRPNSASSWTPVVLDEPSLVVALEPYGDQCDPIGSFGGAAGPDDADRWARLGANGRRLEDVARRGAASLRRDGIASTAQKGLDKLRHRLRG